MSKCSLSLQSCLLLGVILALARPARPDTIPTFVATSISGGFARSNTSYQIAGQDFQVSGIDNEEDFPLAPFEPGQPIAGAFAFGFPPPFGTAPQGSVTIDNVTYSAFFYTVLGFTTSLGAVNVPFGAGYAPLESGTVVVPGTAQGHFFACVLGTPPTDPCDPNFSNLIAEFTIDLPVNLSIDFDYTQTGEPITGTRLGVAPVPEPSNALLILAC